MIWDCFTFYNELDVLELRLSLLEDVVDRFVICEAPFTFRGAAKPLVYEQHKARFARWNDRIVHLVYRADADTNPWQNEWGQRAFLTTGVADAEPDDLILISDVDEIPAPGLVAQRPRPGRALAHQHRFSVGYFNRIAPQGWLGTRALPRSVLGTMTLNHIRSLAYSELEVIESGWHLSSLGGPTRAAEKYHAYSHTEVDIPYFNDRLRLAFQFASEWDARWVPLDATFPPIMRDPRWSAYVWPRPARHAPTEALRVMHAHGCYASVPAGAAAIGALARDARSVWQTIGAERFGNAFAGAFATVSELLATVPAGGWAVVDGLEGLTARELRELAERGLNVVGFARNARSYATLKGVIAGEPFPAGIPRGRAELEADIRGAGLRIDGCDAVMSSIFAQSIFEGGEPLEATVGDFRFSATTRAAINEFSTDAYVFALCPAPPEPVPPRGPGPSAIDAAMRRDVVDKFLTVAVTVVTTRPEFYAEAAVRSAKMSVWPIVPSATQLEPISDEHVILDGLDELVDPAAFLRVLRRAAPHARIFAFVAHAGYAIPLVTFLAGDATAHARPFAEAEIETFFAENGWRVLHRSALTDPNLRHPPPFKITARNVALTASTPEIAARLSTAGFLVIADPNDTLIS